MKYYGDIPHEHLELVKELQYLENLVNTHIDDFPLLALAKGYTCMSHDYISMFMEEEAVRLLHLAEKHCPGYYTAPILVQMKKDKEFNKLIQALKTTPALEVMKSLGFEDEPV